MSMSSQLKDTKTDTQNLIELTKRLQLERYTSKISPCFYFLLFSKINIVDIISLIFYYSGEVCLTNNYWQTHI